MTRQERLRNRVLTIDFAAMANSVDHYTMDRILNRIEDSVLTHSHPVRIGRTFQFLGVHGSGVGGKGFDRMLDGGTDLMGQTAELSGSRRRIEDRVHGRVGLRLQQGVDLRHREESVAPMGLQIGEIPKIFEEVEESPKLVERELNSSPPSSDVHHVLGMQFGHSSLRGSISLQPYHTEKALSRIAGFLGNSGPACRANRWVLTRAAQAGTGTSMRKWEVSARTR